LEHRGASAGSLRDLTRVAKLNEEMWSQLFFENRDALLCELDILLNSLSAYRDALVADDRDRMKALLAEGRIRKEQMDHPKG
jgi:prephenate dehydrogenase